MNSTSYFVRPGYRLMSVRLPDQEAVAMAVPSGSWLVIRMDVHPRPSCIIVPGAPIRTAFERLGIAVEAESEEWLRSGVSAEQVNEL